MPNPPDGVLDQRGDDDLCFFLAGGKEAGEELEVVGERNLKVGTLEVGGSLRRSFPPRSRDRR
jgi:hypothetical protein